jgi:hypothetical protein
MEQQFPLTQFPHTDPPYDDPQDPSVVTLDVAAAATAVFTTRLMTGSLVCTGWAEVARREVAGGEVAGAAAAEVSLQPNWHPFAARQKESAFPHQLNHVNSNLPKRAIIHTQILNNILQRPQQDHSQPS